MTKGPIKNVAASVRQWLRNVAHTTHRRFSDVLQHYEGVRARFQATLGNSRIAMQVDIGFSDVITPAPATIRYPSLLKLPTAELLGYNRETAIAEKFEAMVKLGELNSRMKDFFDPPPPALWSVRGNGCAALATVSASRPTRPRRAARVGTG
ncbi:MAG: nucleotidyl transferase AbiEii/AbiGii toxin family protein [Planctomycetota bacterium]|nr:nucleotidyl transferase AbiEii/AbiGii toxin family protein [Planctomycetota bacterium]